MVTRSGTSEGLIAVVGYQDEESNIRLCWEDSISFPNLRDAQTQSHGGVSLI